VIPEEDIEKIHQKLDEIEQKLDRVSNYLFEESYRGQESRALRLDRILSGVQTARLSSKFFIGFVGFLTVVFAIWAQFVGWFSRP